MSNEIPKVKESTRLNLLTSIWIVPIIALIVALWLVWQHYSRLGPEIRIIFPKNEGLQAGQSQIKYKDVPVGKVTKIELTEDGKGVIVYAQMKKMASEYLNETTKFWIVKPEVGVSGVSGLETLISGTYINMYAQKKVQNKEQFYGLTHTYRKNTEGEYFILTAPEAYTVTKNTPVYFKNLQVGQVEYVTIGLDGKSIEFIIFIDRRYVPYVHKDSKFWVMSTFDVDVSSGRVDLNIAPLPHLVRSGIEFSSSGEDSSDTVPEKFGFYLYKNVALANQKKIGQGGAAVKTYRMITYDPVSKLNINAPVRYEGFDVGYVKGMKLQYESHTHKVKGEILLDIDTSSFGDENSGERNFLQAVQEGLRARVTPTDPITGLLYIDLVFTDENGTRQVEQNGTYALLPSVPMEQSSVVDGIERIVAKINGLPLDSLIGSISQLVKDSDRTVQELHGPLRGILADLKESAKALKKMMTKKSFAVMPNEINKTLKELTRTLNTTKKVLKGYDSNSLLTRQISQTLKSVTKSSQEMQQFLRMLNRKPNSLIFGDK